LYNRKKGAADRISSVKRTGLYSKIKKTINEIIIISLIMIRKGISIP
jgi:hypothetical protein